MTDPWHTELETQARELDEALDAAVETATDGSAYATDMTTALFYLRKARERLARAGREL